MYPSAVSEIESACLYGLERSEAGHNARIRIFRIFAAKAWFGQRSGYSTKNPFFRVVMKQQYPGPTGPRKIQNGRRRHNSELILLLISFHRAYVAIGIECDMTGLTDV